MCKDNVKRVNGKAIFALTCKKVFILGLKNGTLSKNDYICTFKTKQNKHYNV